MGTQNAVLEKFLRDRNPQMTKEGADEAIKKLEDSFIKAATSEGVSPAELLKIAQDHPETWNQMVNNYVGELVVAAEQEKQAEAQRKQAEAGQMAKVAEDIASGQRIAHAFLDELAKTAALMDKAAAEDEKDEKKDEKDDGKKPAPGMPPALAAAMAGEEKREEKKEPPKEESKEGSKLPLSVLVNRRAVEKKAEAGLPVSADELDFLALCKLGELGHNVDWSNVK